VHGSRYNHAGHGGCTYATAHEKVRELGQSVGVGGVAQESDAAVSDALIFQLQAPETELTVHFYGHGAKLYENSILMR
jgi:hypothetical protein